jgi:hypothetical protein
MNDCVKPVKPGIFIDADADSALRRLLDERRREIVIDIVCRQCQKQVPFNCCAVGLEGECVLEWAAEKLDGGCQL